MPICRECVGELIAIPNQEQRWNMVDKICQFADLPFVPEEFEKLYLAHGGDAFGLYAAIFREKDYESLDWKEYNEAYLKLKEADQVEVLFPSIIENQMETLRRKWGREYDDDQIYYLENLYDGIANTVDIVSSLNDDQILKLCKTSLIIEEKMRAGLDFDKDLKNYENLCKLAGITNEALKSSEEFNSTGELYSYLEQMGFKPKYWKGAIRDEVDKSMKDFMYWARYMYINEPGIASEIQERIEGLKNIDQINKISFDWDEYHQFEEEIEDHQNFEFDI